jgi:hypothetical protein
MARTKQKRGLEVKVREMDKCEDCKHYWFVDSAYGECRRYPPQLVPVRVRGYIFATKLVKEFPLMEFDSGVCGEFKRREK